VADTVDITYQLIVDLLQVEMEHQVRFLELLNNMALAAAAAMEVIAQRDQLPVVLLAGEMDLFALQAQKQP
jgi:hypothetical protein